MLTDTQRLEMLKPPGKDAIIDMVLDTDTYNEVDDQFALAYAILSQDRLNVEAIYAAPFHNTRSTSPGDGMEKSYQEILRLLELMRCDQEGIAFRGAERFMASGQAEYGGAVPVHSEAAQDIVERGMRRRNRLLYVVAIGAPTNVASALLMEPELAERIVVVWLGGQPYHWPTAQEFNLRQDLSASRILFDSGVPLVHIPCLQVAELLATTVPELEHYLRGKSALGDYLYTIVRDYGEGRFGWSKPLWDIAAVAWLIRPDWVPTAISHSPVLTSDLTWSFDALRHLVKVALRLDRDAIFADVFQKLQQVGI